MSDYSEHEQACIDLMDEMGDDCPVITYGGSTIKILPGTAMRRSTNGMGGLSMDSDFACTALASSFSALPKSNQPITYLSKGYKITEVRIIAGGKLYRILANDAANSL